MARFHRRALAAALLIGLALPAQAQAPAPQPVFKLGLGYDGRLIFKVLDIRVDQSANPTGFSSTARLQASGILAAFKKLDQHASAQGEIVNGDARPREFRHQNIDGKRNRKVVVTWADGDVRMTADPTYGKKLGDPPASLAQKLEASDPLTQLMRVSLGDRQADFCRGSMKFFDGKQRYDLEFLNRETVAPTAREKRLGLVNPVRCTVRYREIAGFKKKSAAQQNQGLKRPIVIGFAEVGEGGPWVISFLDAQTPLGHALIELQRVSTSGETPD